MLTFKIAPDSEPEYTVTATTRDIMKWEKTTRGASFAKLQLEQKITDLYRIAFLASTRQGLYSGTAEEFEAECDLDMLNDDEDESADPFPPAA